MRYAFIVLIGLFLSTCGVSQQPALRKIRLVDTLTVLEKNNRNPLLLRSELDSLIAVYATIKEEKPFQQPVKEKSDPTIAWFFGGLILVVLLIGVISFFMFRQQQKLIDAIKGGTEKQKGKGKNSTVSLESKIGELDAELHKLTKENEGLNRVISEYNGIKHEYDTLRHGMQKAYKISNYPGNDKSKDETLAMKGVLQTEQLVANYAYEKFLKPVLAIADANKNNPAKMPEEERIRLMDLLISLSLLYIEYLYLRVNELSIGGNMVTRIQAFSLGKSPDPSLLKKLNRQAGSRALVISMALNRASLSNLSYPVFDETNLNN